MAQMERMVVSYHGVPTTMIKLALSIAAIALAIAVIVILAMEGFFSQIPQ